MNFFRKKLIIKYEDILQKEDAENTFEAIPKNFPKYFYSIPKTIFNPERKKFIPHERTIRTCPGFINLYKRSLLVKSPFDIYVELDDTKIIYQMAGRTDFTCATIHSGEQLLNYIPKNKYKFIMKICLPFFIDTNVSLYLSESSYHFNDLNMLPGMLPNNYNGDLNFFILVGKEQNEINIKKGDPLFLITPLYEKKIKLNFKKYNEKHKGHLTFSNLKKFVLKNLI